MKLFNKLTSPINFESFFSNYYEKKPLLIQRSNPEYYNDILEVMEIDNYLANHDIQYPSLRLVKDGAEVNKKLYLIDIDYGTSKFKGLVDNDRMFHLFNKGATIVIQKLNRSVEKLGSFCRGLESEIPFSFQSNIYITPKESKGFVEHYDTHDVFVMQISGNKKWTLYEPNSVTLPTKKETFRSKETNISEFKVSKCFDLKQGDLLYIPRGFIHKAESTKDNSIHITMGVFPEKWYDLLRYISIESFIVDSLKTTLPFSLSNGQYDFNKIKKNLKSKVIDLMEDKVLDKILKQYSQNINSKRKSSDYGRLNDLLEIDLINSSTKFVLRNNIVYSLSKKNKLIILKFYNKTISLPLPVELGMQIILRGKEFDLNDLKESKLNEQSRTILVKKMLKEGLIKILK